MSKLKSYFLDFINLIAIWAILVFMLVIFILGSEIELLSKTVKSIVPLAFFTLILLLVLKVERSKLDKYRYSNMFEITLYLTYAHKFIDKIIIFFLPVLIILVAFVRGGVEVYDIVQALLVSLVLYVWHKVLFKNT